jgi:hypothetical protein
MDEFAVDAQRECRLADPDPSFIDGAGDARLQRQGPRRRRDTQRIDFDGAGRFDSDRSPGTHGRDCRRPSGDASQESGTEPAQVLLLDEPGLPLRPRARLLERAAQRTEADHKLVVVAKRVRDVDAVREEHVA